MTLDHSYCEVGNYDDHEQSTDISPLNITTAIVDNFAHLFDLNPADRLSSDLSKIRFLLCFRAEVISLLFIVLYLGQFIVIYLTQYLTALFVRQRSGNFIQKKKGVYTLESFIFNSFGRNSCGKDSETCDGTFYVRPSKFVFVKKCFILILIFLHLIEIYWNIPTIQNLTHFSDVTTIARLVFSFSVLSCLIRVIALILIAHHLLRQTQPPEKIVFNCDSLSPSIYSRANQALISIFWIVVVLNTLLNIRLSVVNFIVQTSGPVNIEQLNSTQPLNSTRSTVQISTLEACSHCEWKTFSPLENILFPRTRFSKASIAPFSNLTEWRYHEPESYVIASDYTMHNFANHHDLTFHFFFDWLYLWMFLAQLLLAFFPDFVVKSQSQSEASLNGLIDLSIIDKSNSKKSKLDTNPEDRATFLSKLTFTWFDSTIFNGYRHPLSLFDIFPPSWANRVEVIAKKFASFLKRKNKSQFEHSKGFGQFDKFRLISILVRQFGLEYVQIAVIKLVPTLLTFLSPILLDRLMRFVKNDEPDWHGYVYVAAMFLLPLIESILNSMSDYRLNILALKIRSCLTAAIYERMLRCRSWSTSGSRFTTGQLVNIMSIDTQRVLEYIKTVNLFWICPLQIAIAISMLWSHLGYGSLAGLAVLLLLLPFNGYIGTKLRSLQGKLLDFKDNRVKVLNETISSIRAIKLYAWEEVFQKRILSWRKGEVCNLRRQAYYSTAITFAFNSAPFLVAFASFALYLLLNEDNRLDAQKIFVSLTIFNIIRRPLAFFPQLITNSMMFMVSMKRIGDFFDSIDDSSSQSIELLPRRYSQKSPIPLIDINNCSFSWSSSRSIAQIKGGFQLSNISLQISESNLCAIIGEIGSGKSSLLSAVLGQMNLLDDLNKFGVSGTFAYIPQEAWIQSGTIRENILFGKKFDRKWYQKVVEACALEKDFKQMTDGDQMIVGQKGISLSGGQKQRISIARALYSNADIYLFDDPLSALDSQISKHVFNRVISSTGLLSSKIRLLVTHNMAILPRVDQILLLKNGSIAASGQFRELMDEENEFTDFLAGFLSEPNSNSSLARADSDEPVLSEESEVGPEDREVLEEMANRLERQFCSFTRRGSIRRQFSCQSPNEPKLISFTCMSSPKMQGTPPSFPVSKFSSRKEIVNESSEQIESTKSGSVSCKVYLKYIGRVGLITSSAILLFFFFGHVFMLLAQLWLSTWSSDDDKSNSPLRPLYKAINSSSISKTNRNMSLLGVYGLLGFVQTIFILVGTLLLNIGCLRASGQVHNQMLTRLMTVPIWFYDATSSSTGQILNRFTKDVDIVDTVLISNFLKLVIEMFRTIASFCPIIIGTDPVIALFVIPLIFIYFTIYKYCISTSRQLIRLESALRTPIYSYFMETYSGVSLIQAFGAEQRFIVRNYRNIDKNASAYHMSVAAARWLTIRLELLGNLVVLSTAMFCVIKRGDIDSGMVGLCMSCAFVITSTLNMLIRSFTDLESNIVSMERLLEFTELPQEAARYLSDSEKEQLSTAVDKCAINALFSNCVPLCSNDLYQAEEGLIQPSPALSNRVIARSGQWLHSGVITICQYSARYRDNLDYCLRNMNLSIEHGQKVAIVGRTGAGKSSFALSLFRLIEAQSGCICIGGYNIKELGLYELRSSLTIIPQDALLFSGTLRENMDPLNQYTDDQILIALAKVNLNDLLVRLCQGPKLGNALDQQLDEGRLQAISAGQKQLLCLARVLLRQPKVLILDEATAAIDPATDELVQETIFREFNDCTVLSIVHRLHTVIRYPIDRVLVLDGGRVAEFDSPQRLMSNQDSLFYGMLQNRL